MFDENDVPDSVLDRLEFRWNRCSAGLPATMAAPRKLAAKAPTRRDPLAALRMSDMVIMKPHLPYELMAQIVDHLNAADMIRMARASRKMHEMVYEDARWIQRLKRMRVWNELDARRTGSSQTAALQPRRSVRGTYSKTTRSECRC